MRDGKLDQAIAVLEDAHARHPGHLDTLVAVATFQRDAGRPQAALGYARRLQQLMPDDPSVDRLVRQLDARAP